MEDKQDIEMSDFDVDLGEFKEADERFLEAIPRAQLRDSDAIIKKATAGLAMDCRVGLRWYFPCGCPISQPIPVLDFSSKKIRGRFFNFFLKSKNELVRPKTMFLAILAKIRSFPNSSDI